MSSRCNDPYLPPCAYRDRAQVAEATLARVRKLADNWLRLSGAAIDPEVKKWTEAVGRSVLAALTEEMK